MYYHNPVISVSDVDHGDPAILKYNGKYYLYHTGQYEILVYESTNLVDWEKIGVALAASKDQNHWAQVDFGSLKLSIMMEFLYVRDRCDDKGRWQCR